MRETINGPTDLFSIGSSSSATRFCLTKPCGRPIVKKTAKLTTKETKAQATEVGPTREMAVKILISIILMQQIEGHKICKAAAT